MLHCNIDVLRCNIIVLRCNVDVLRCNPADRSGAAHGSGREAVLERRGRGLERRLGTRPVDAQARLAPYPVGKTVNVLYSRDNPGAAWLEGSPSDGPTQTYYYRVMALACALACAVMATIALGVL